jgi:hypothetical protein
MFAGWQRERLRELAAGEAHWDAKIRKGREPLPFIGFLARTPAQKSTSLRSFMFDIEPVPCEHRCPIAIDIRDIVQRSLRGRER